MFPSIVPLRQVFRLTGTSEEFASGHCIVTWRYVIDGRISHFPIPIGLHAEITQLKL